MIFKGSLNRCRDFARANPVPGVQKGKFHITVDFLGHIFRASSAGSSPRNSYLSDMFFALIGYVRFLIFL